MILFISHKAIELQGRKTCAKFPNRIFSGRLRSKPPGRSTMKIRSRQSRPPGIVSRQAWPISNAATMKRQAGCAPRSSPKLPRFTKAKRPNHKPLPGSRQGFFARNGEEQMDKILDAEDILGDARNCVECIFMAAASLSREE